MEEREVTRKWGKKQRKREVILGHGERNRGKTIGHKKSKSFKTWKKGLKDTVTKRDRVRTALREIRFTWR